MQENGYGKKGDWNMGDYSRINVTHLLSDYEVKVPHWTGKLAIRRPFLAWADNKQLPWYAAYNKTKHDRHSQFEQATFEHLIDACCGLLVLLSAQFETNSFSPGQEYLALEGGGDGYESGIGGYFRVKFPQNWPPDLRYEFSWQELENDPDPFQAIDYSKIPSVQINN